MRPSQEPQYVILRDVFAAFAAVAEVERTKSGAQAHAESRLERFYQGKFGHVGFAPFLAGSDSILQNAPFTRAARMFRLARAALSFSDKKGPFDD
jgi:hypothetical protein